jgi:hypothetical protein
VCLEIGKRYWFGFDAIGTDGDHVHVFVGAAPIYASSNVILKNKELRKKKKVLVWIFDNIICETIRIPDFRRTKGVLNKR